MSLFTENWWLLSIPQSSVLRGYWLFQICFSIFICLSIFLSKFRDKVPFKNEIDFFFGLEIYFYNILNIIFLLIIIIFLFKDSALYQLVILGNTDSFLLAELRASIGVNYEGPKMITYFQNIGIKYIIPYIFIYFYLAYLRTKRYKLSTLIAFFVLVFSSSLTLEKSYIVNIILIIALCRYTVGKVNIGAYVIFGIFTILVLYFFVMGKVEPIELLSALSERIFQAQYFGFPVVLDVFPTQIDFLGISGVNGTIAKIFNEEYMSYSRLTMEIVNPNGVKNGIAGYLSTIFWAEAYALYGTYFMFFSIFITVLIFFILDRFFANSIRLPFRAFYVLLLLKIPFIVVVDWMTLVYNVSGIILFIMILLIDYLNLMFRNDKDIIHRN